VSIIRNLELHDPAYVKQINPSIPTSLANLIHRLLSKDREQRPRSAEELAETLLTLDRTEAAPTFFSAPRPSSHPTPVPSLGFLAPGVQPRPTPAPVAMPSMPVYARTQPPTPNSFPTMAPPIPTHGVVESSHQGAEVPDLPQNSSGGGFFKFLFVLLLFGGGGYWAWTEFLDRGTLTIETEDRTVEVEIRHKGVVKKMLITDRSCELRPGTYELTLVAGQRGSKLEKTSVNLQRGQTEKVKVIQE
jgi:serine/threonine protein kinase